MEETKPHLILGIDEVGRGPWAGPLVMGGCILPPHDNDDISWISELTDSKKLTPKKRERLAKIIKENSLVCATGWVHATELNEIGLSAGLRLACRRVVENIQQEIAQKKSASNSDESPVTTSYPLQFHEIVIDGSINFLANTKLAPFVTNLNKADLLIKEVSAASIIAKVEHDIYMRDVAKKYPEFGFESHVGYGTAKHITAIKTHGITPEHRTFIKPIAALISSGECPTHQAKISTESPVEFSVKPTTKNTTNIGNKAEQIVADCLAENGHTILARNFKTKTCEIDIVSELQNKIYFTEVKYRKTTKHGSGLESITPKKHQQMTYAANFYLKKNHLLDRSTTLAAASVSGPDFQLDAWLEI